MNYSLVHVQFHFMFTSQPLLNLLHFHFTIHFMFTSLFTLCSLHNSLHLHFTIHFKITSHFKWISNKLNINIMHEHLLSSSHPRALALVNDFNQLAEVSMKHTLQLAYDALYLPRTMRISRMLSGNWRLVSIKSQRRIKVSITLFKVFKSKTHYQTKVNQILEHS